MSNTNSTVALKSMGLVNSLLAFGLSWHVWHSFWWGLLHFFCGWFYLVYWLFVYGPFN